MPRGWAWPGAWRAWLPSCGEGPDSPPHARIPLQPPGSAGPRVDPPGEGPGSRGAAGALGAGRVLRARDRPHSLPRPLVLAPGPPLVVRHGLGRRADLLRAVRLRHRPDGQDVVQRSGGARVPGKAAVAPRARQYGRRPDQLGAGPQDRRRHRPWEPWVSRELYPLPLRLAGAGDAQQCQPLDAQFRDALLPDVPCDMALRAARGLAPLLPGCRDGGRGGPSRLPAVHLLLRMRRPLLGHGPFSRLARSQGHGLRKLAERPARGRGHLASRTVLGLLLRPACSRPVDSSPVPEAAGYPARMRVAHPRPDGARPQMASGAGAPQPRRGVTGAARALPHRRFRGHRGRGLRGLCGRGRAGLDAGEVEARAFGAGQDGAIWRRLLRAVRRLPCDPIRHPGAAKPAARDRVELFPAVCSPGPAVLRDRVAARPEAAARAPPLVHRTPPRWRTASNSVISAAIATLSESAWPAIGIRTQRSAFPSQKALRPYCSLPMTTARGPRRSDSV